MGINFDKLSIIIFMNPILFRLKAVSGHLTKAQKY